MCLGPVQRGMGLVEEELRHRAAGLRRGPGFKWEVWMRAQVLLRCLCACGVGRGATMHEGSLGSCLAGKLWLDPELSWRAQIWDCPEGTGMHY